ncbi:hypothetical protein [Eisenibacter elegans]|uniref:hypothetical protein n=1 Tax=Eisenibacter elegans TaxID=997 RepID=UPI0012B66F23|nr:hypothetical protein [Eisenibacter elegans]
MMPISRRHLICGSYYFHNEAGERVYAGRMPHYGFRLWLPKTWAYNALVLFQLVLHAVSVVVALLAYVLCAPKVGLLGGFYGVPA